MADRSKLELIQAGVALDVSDEINYVHEASEGFGMPPLHRLSERGPMQHGETDVGYRLDPRLINVVIGVIGADWATLYANRAQLLSYLNPAETTGFRFTLPDGTQYQLDVYVVSGPLFSSSDFVGFFVQKAGFTLKAPDPTWYDPIGEFVTFALGGGSGAFEVPMVVPHTVGASVLDQNQALSYLGTAISYPVITISGPITDPILVNTVTGEKLDFTGATISAGNWIEIDTRYGRKTVLDQAGASQVALLTTDSDLATFHIALGNNSFNVTGSAVTEQTEVEMRYFTRFLGI